MKEEVEILPPDDPIEAMKEFLILQLEMNIVQSEFNDNVIAFQRRQALFWIMVLVESVFLLLLIMT